MNKQGDNIYLIKDLSRMSGHSVHTLKFYLKYGLIQESGRSPETRFRYFDDRTVQRLSTIRSLRKEGKGLSEILRRLNGEGSQQNTGSSRRVPTAQSPEPTAALP